MLTSKHIKQPSHVPICPLANSNALYPWEGGTQKIQLFQIFENSFWFFQKKNGVPEPLRLRTAENLLQAKLDY